MHPECFNDGDLQIFARKRKIRSAWDNLTYIREAARIRVKLNDLKEPAIIISASGMCEAGRIRHHLQNNIGDERNTVMFIGYCAENTLGAQIMAHRKPGQYFRRTARQPAGARSSRSTRIPDMRIKTNCAVTSST